MITTIATISADEIPDNRNVRNVIGDEWTICLSEDPDHQVQIMGTVAQLYEAQKRISEAVRTAQAMATAKRVSAEQNAALADRALGVNA